MNVQMRQPGPSQGIAPETDENWFLTVLPEFFTLMHGTDIVGDAFSQNQDHCKLHNELQTIISNHMLILCHEVRSIVCLVNPALDVLEGAT